MGIKANHVGGFEAGTAIVISELGRVLKPEVSHLQWAAASVFYGEGFAVRLATFDKLDGTRGFDVDIRCTCYTGISAGDCKQGDKAQKAVSHKLSRLAIGAV